MAESYFREDEHHERDINDSIFTTTKATRIVGWAALDRAGHLARFHPSGFCLSGTGARHVSA